MMIPDVELLLERLVNRLNEQEARIKELEDSDKRNETK
jgi:hypothetical protein